TALLFLVLMLPNLIWLRLGTSENLWVDALVIPGALLLTLFALLGNRPWVACLVLAPFAMLAPLEAFYIGTYHRPTFAEILATIATTNPRELREYLGGLLPLLALCLVLGLLVALLATWWSHRSQLRWPRVARIWVLALAIAAPLAVCIVAGVTATGGRETRFHSAEKRLSSLAVEIQYGYPFGLFQRVAEYHRMWKEMRTDAARLDAFRFHAHRVADFDRRQVYVLVIGEASRRANWQLFGYDRATNPELTHLPNLVPLLNLDSSWPESITAIPMILTRKPAGDIEYAWWKEASILRAMQEAGFETWWISNQMPIGKYDSPVSTYAYEAQHTAFLNHVSWSAPGSYDEDLLQPLHDALQDSTGDLFIVLHMLGSHQSYDYRYPEAYKHFRPAESDPWGTVPESEKSRNSYDNSILYSDHVLASIIGVLRDSGAVTALWYESDHGETLPTSTCSAQGHGHGTHAEYEISALSWYSDAYANAFPTRVAALRANAGKRLMSEGTFESIIDMAGLDFPGHDPSWSAFSRQWRYHPRIVNRPSQIDIDRAKFDKFCGLVHALHG
ncbi:MAG TPA: phosphoethanolamine transferase, partial [Xanthomonadaceae bacterium]|nr:phosphoethanolamine transferase [Xanthomonadaceae bacterium]